MGVATGPVREEQGAQATTTRSTGDGMPAMGGDSASEDEPGEQPRGGGSFCSLGSSLERTGGADTTTSTRSGSDPSWSGVRGRGRSAANYVVGYPFSHLHSLVCTI